MSRRRYPGLRVLALLALIGALGPAGDGWGQKPPAPGQPNPQAPTLAPVAPLGMQRGTALELTLTGTNLAGPTGLWTSFPAKVTFPTDNNNGKDNAKLRVRLEVPKDAPLGFHGLRLATTRGMSNLRLFCIDDLPQVTEADNNRAKETAMAVQHPCVVVGRADAEARDFFKINVKAGERVSFEVLGRRLGSAFDPQLTLLDPRTDRELPGGYNNDAPGLQTDARLTYTFKEAGDYLIELRDTTHRGGPDFWYRLRIGDFPCATAPVPLAVKRGSKATVNFAGPAVEGVAPVEVTAPDEPGVDTRTVAPRGANGLYGWPVSLHLSDLDERVEQEPNDDPAKPNPLPVPGAITGRFQQKDDRDHYAVAAKKGQRLILDAQSLEFHSPSLVYLSLKDAKGAEVAKSNPAAVAPLDQRIDFTPPADGDYTLEVTHLNYEGGPAEVYRVTALPYEPGFDLALLLDRYDLPQDGTLSVSVTAARRDYTGPIELSVLGPPGLSGQATLAAGQPAQPNQPVSLQLVKVGPEVALGPYAVVVQGKATINNKPVVGYASVRNLVSQGLGNLSYPPRQLTTHLALAVTEKPPFFLTAKLDESRATPGKPVSLTVTASRAPGFAEEIALTAVGLPPNVTAALKNIPKDQNEVKASLNLAANAPVGTFQVSFSGKAKYQNKDFAVTSPPVALVIAAAPFELKAEPSPVKLAPEGKAKITVTVTRKTYQGPIAVELRNLPAHVTAPKATIAAGQNAAEIEISAAADAAAGDKADVHVLGTATEAGNQQVVSPNLTVSVAKK